MGCNVETFVNLAAAAEGRAVTHKTLPIAGAVREPVLLTVPLGKIHCECIAAAGMLVNAAVIMRPHPDVHWEGI